MANLEPIVLRVVASVSGATSESDGVFVEGMRLAEQEINAMGGVAGSDLRLEVTDDEGDRAAASDLITEALGSSAVAILTVGPAGSVTAVRAAIESARTPVVLLGGDLYSGRSLFRYAFQTTIPLRWQARVISRYLVRDRGHDQISLVVEEGPEEDVAREIFRAAMAEEGSTPVAVASIPQGGPGRTFPGIPPLDPGPVLEAAEGADAVVFFGSVVTAAAVSRALGPLTDPPRLAMSADALQPSFAAGNRPRPGTVTPYAYTWSGWAGMIPRVGEFRDRFAGSPFAHVPAGLEQEGYDAVRAAAAALEATGGRGGEVLVRALESFRDQTYSSLPIRLGPDDHVLAEESHLGLFAVAAPGDEPPEPEAWSLVPWRPIMRTFTTDGERVNLLDEDKPIFFPGWRPRRPTPKYPRSRYGIVTGAEDPLH